MNTRVWWSIIIVLLLIIIGLAWVLFATPAPLPRITAITTILFLYQS